MTDKERTCLFHYVQSMIKYTEKWIADEFQEQHKSLCKQYRDASTIEDADRLFDALQAWYKMSGAVSDKGFDAMSSWLAWWHFRYRQWGGFMTTVCRTIYQFVSTCT